jgi:hypothetical protein
LAVRAAPAEPVHLETAPAAPAAWVAPAASVASAAPVAVTETAFLVVQAGLPWSVRPVTPAWPVPVLVAERAVQVVPVA